jgi:hypothetical protein
VAREQQLDHIYYTLLYSSGLALLCLSPALANSAKMQGQNHLLSQAVMFLLFFIQF